MICLLFLLLLTRLTAGEEGEDLIAVRLAPGVSPEHWCAERHVRLVRALSFLPDFYLVSAPKERRARDLVAEAPRQALWAETQVVRPKRFTRYIPDSLWPMQWSLHSHPFAVEVDKVGNLTGAGVTIAIVDDGLQWAHPEIKGNYDGPHSWDYNDGDADPTPVGPHAGHGTSAAGVAAAVGGNGHCGRGAAPRARLVGLRTIAEGVSDATEAEALTHEGLGVVALYSNSWGPIDDAESMEGPGYMVQAALSSYAGALRGRLGKGSIYLWASGNGAAKGDSCAFDGYASSPYVFAIGALDHRGVVANYSEGCASLFAVAPSSGAGRGITSADLMGADGYTDSDCTISFGGTSAATPLAAGLIALLLEAQPQLSWRDVMYVMARGALLIDQGSPDWHTNAAGYHHSYRYGFGMLHAPSLLRALAAHTLLANRTQVIWSSGFKALDEVYITADGEAGARNVTINVTGAGALISVLERVTLHLTLRSETRGTLAFDLVSPEGTLSQMCTPRANDASTFWPEGGWAFHSVRHLGERTVDGPWLVLGRDTGTPNPYVQTHFIGFELELRGAPRER